jgi:hypothetical protein
MSRQTLKQVASLFQYGLGGGVERFVTRVSATRHDLQRTLNPPHLHLITGLETGRLKHLSIQRETRTIIT